MSDEKFFCQMPFTHMHIHKGTYHTCCPPWLDPSCGVHELHDDLWEVWNSPQFQKLRTAVLSGSDRFCQACPLRAADSNLRRRTPEPDEQPVMERPPITINYGADAICNLSCPSCRVEPITTDQQATGPLSLQHIVDQFSGLKTVGVSLFGDPFASPQIRQWLQESSDPPHVILWTNGLLIPRYWDTVKRIVTVISTSVDGASKEVYEKMRRGGRWENILKSIDFCSGMVADPKCSVQMLQYNYVIQTGNYKDMPAFVDLIRGKGAQKILFTPLDARYPMTKEYWRHANICNPYHPQHANFVRVLQDDRLKDPIADILVDNEGCHNLGSETPRRFQ